MEWCLQDDGRRQHNHKRHNYRGGGSLLHGDEIQNQYGRGNDGLAHKYEE